MAVLLEGVNISGLGEIKPVAAWDGNIHTSRHGNGRVAISFRDETSVTGYLLTLSKDDAREFVGKMVIALFCEETRDQEDPEWARNQAAAAWFYFMHKACEGC